MRKRLCVFGVVLLLSGCAASAEVRLDDGYTPEGREAVAGEKRDLARLYLGLGEIYYRDFVDFRKACECYRRYLELAPGGDGAGTVRDRLKEMSCEPEAPAAPATAESRERTAAIPAGSSETAVSAGAEIEMPKESSLEETGAGAEEASPAHPAGDESGEPAPVSAAPAYSPPGKMAALAGMKGRDFQGAAVSFVKEGTAGSLIFLWKEITPRTINLIKDLILFCSRGEGMDFICLAATSKGSTSLPDYLKEKGIDVTLVDDWDGKLSAVLGVSEYPALAVADPGGTILKVVQEWDGSGLPDCVRPLLERHGGK